MTLLVSTVLVITVITSSVTVSLITYNHIGEVSAETKYTNPGVAILRRSKCTVPVAPV